ncbi:MAG: alanine--tRNA ligase [Gammaproteobacteria bacterium]|nr:alanine--tRNA ligase [Gammaproteobacteria bacterium]MBM4230183.1 alanine--tRNA ligase [Gammaproteobacteria bacterium]
MSAAQVRRAFLEFFQGRGHAIVASSSLVPGNDPTLLFTNAGMVQFKDVFLGKDKRDYLRATTSQRCVRAGGKHNDLENVGYTARHHTFFEMLGNFSFGDYFKRDAIRYAWDFVTGTLQLDPGRLWVTVFKDDDEAADIWIKEIGVAPERLTRMGEKSNFWAMGDTGPCGPCTEIFYDHGAHIPGGPPGSPDEDGDRYVEIWNLVFMQYDRAPDGTLTPLPKPSVDTGAGLERLSAVMQGITSNYDIDLFRGIVQAAADLADTKDLANPSLRVIADHIRACTFLIVDGVLPSNEGRGYVLRRIIRRAIRHGHKLGINGAFFHKLVSALETQMGEAYPELRAGADLARRVLLQEEERFAETLNTGMSLLTEALDRLGPGRVLDGETVFRLYDTYGFPADLTGDVARERGFAIDNAGFEAAMEAQRERARAASRFGVDLRGGAQIDVATRFCGYESTRGESKVIALLREGERVSELKPGERGEVILETTPFYAESGGQVGDAGELSASGVRFIVEDTQKRGTAGAHSHLGHVAADSGVIREGTTLAAMIDERLRGATALNHSATHLLHAALREVLGTHVQQKGSLVAPDRLRFDFSHFQAISVEELQRIERRVNEQIRLNAAAETREMDYEAAVVEGATALFGEKYSSTVRVLRIGEFSKELCGGTHVSRAGDIGLFKITAEGGVAAGVRRIEAVTGEGALAAAEASEALVKEIAGLVRGTREDVATKVRDALERIRQLEKETRTLRDKLASGQGTDLAAGAVDVGGLKVVATTVDGADAGALRNAVDQLKDRLKTAVIVLASTDAAGKVTLVAGVTAGEVGRIKAGEVVGHVAAQIGGRGGGRPDFAQAGGSDAAQLPAALAGVVGFVRQKIGA